MPWWGYSLIIAFILVYLFVLAIVIIGARADRETPQEWL